MRPERTENFRKTPVRTSKRVASADTFGQWVGTRSLPSLSTNAGAAPLPFQQWQKFKEAFSPELVQKAVSGSGRSVRRICDPFGGSGTSALAAQFMGIESVTIEVNPFLADLIKSKVCKYSVRDLLHALPKVARRVRRVRVEVTEFFASLPPTFVEPGRAGKWLFDEPVAKEVAALRKAIDLEEDPKIRRLFRVILGGILVDFSNALVSGKGRRYRRGWQSRRANPELLLQHFCDAVCAAVVEIDACRTRPNAQAQVICGDSRALTREVGAVDLIVSSPPYPNSFDYTDVYNIELWMLGYLDSPTANQHLRRSTLSSHVQVSRQFASPPSSILLDRATKRLRRVRHQLWDSHLVEMVGAYFADLQRVLTGCFEVLAPRGEAWLVVGDSQYQGVRIRVADIIAELAPSFGMKAIRTEPFRSMRASPQQGGNLKLTENLLVLKKL